MRITAVRAIPMSDPVPPERQHRTDLGTKVKNDAVLVLVETDEGLTGIGASLGSPPVLCGVVEHDLEPVLLGEDPMFSERLYEKMYNGSRWKPVLERGHSQPGDGRRGVTMEAIASVDIAIWDVKAKKLGIPVYQALGATRDSVRGYASGGWAPGDEAEQEMARYAAKGFSAVKMRVVGRDGFSIENTLRRVAAARRGIGPSVELMVDAHGSLDISTASGSLDAWRSSTSTGSRSRSHPTTIQDSPRSGARPPSPSPLASESSPGSTSRTCSYTEPSASPSPTSPAPEASPRSGASPRWPRPKASVSRPTPGDRECSSRPASTWRWPLPTATSWRSARVTCP